MLLFNFFLSLLRLIAKMATFNSQEFCNCFAAGDNFDLRRIFYVKEDVFVLELHVLLFMHF